MSVWLNRIATAVPPFEAHGKFLAYAPSMLSDERDRRMFTRLASKAQIERRYTIFEPAPEPDRLDAGDFYVRGSFPPTSARMALFDEHALPLALRACREAIAQTRPADITHLVVTTCTGLSTPGLDLQLQQALGLRSSLERTVIGFMGCYAAINGLKAAWHVVRSVPTAKVLLVNLELCTLHLQENVDLEGMLGFMQFADGCAASLISSEAEGLQLKRFHCDVLPEAAELITWQVGDRGFAMELSPSLPKVLGDNIAGLMNWVDAPINLWAVHPGGRAILDAIQAGLNLPKDALDTSRAVLHDYGNMSSATVMFVLKAMLESSTHGTGLAMAFGPGLTLESMIFDKP
ncbi:MAG: type III polyketide synthase [Planctomycetes bacterium]|nr:type III polyketide synthase [Planctomycetota bacterium]